MPPRRRTNKRRGPLTGSDGLAFLTDDGITPLIDRSDACYSPEEAPAVWDQVRAQVWSHELRDLWPPMGAVVWDGIGEATRAQRPVTPYHGAVWTVDLVREAVNADVASIEAFTRAKPAAAATVHDQLEAYASDLRTLLSICERLGDQVDEYGNPRAAAAGWLALEMRRRDGR